MTTETFTLTADHITLLTNVYVGWSNCEYGAPEIDPKRPYGNGCVEHDIASLLQWPVDDDEGPSQEQRQRASVIHAETQNALQVILDTKSFVPGTYERARYGDRWKLVGTAL